MNYKTIINKENTIYKIVRTINLNGENFQLPPNCTLDFQGGTIINGTINMNNTKILPQGCVIEDYITASIKGHYIIGQCFFDKNINKPKWWTGDKWVDATGIQV